MVFGFGTQDVQEMKEKRDVDGLIKALGYKKDSGVRRDAAEALGEVGDSRAVEPLVWALNDEDSLVRRDAAGTLKKIGDSRAVEPLIRALNDEDTYVRRDAEEALDKLGWTPG
ncbi:MAG: HEAT repeat domain-containing protein [Halobacteriota archaeon]